eukprot:CAMPEP_0119004836 /NCGR_PEP_ID=MMETSP1176-20130426/1383_1 /TAXON_ID=265551 /ORGANISM="Synedropsis recta cf, Strain CCMP1620" /LENGTH=206 /DNA_ID=CAMNT_0006956589 /DNA_START=73 /DNA_END=693 /DNA_ORIENTATION=+
MAPYLNDTFPNLQGSTQDQPDFDLYEYLGSSWGIVFAHPGDFTPVCTTELGKAAELQIQFKNRGVKLCGFSCNTPASHRRWIRDIEYSMGHRVEFPLFCDPTRKCAAMLGILDLTRSDVEGLPLTVRGVFVIKPDKTVAMMMAYPHTSGRNFDELLRIVNAMMLTEAHSIATPVNWQRGDDVIVSCDLDNEEAKLQYGAVSLYFSR